MGLSCNHIITIEHTFNLWCFFSTVEISSNMTEHVVISSIHILSLELHSSMHEVILRIILRTIYSCDLRQKGSETFTGVWPPRKFDVKHCTQCQACIYIAGTIYLFNHILIIIPVSDAQVIASFFHAVNV